MPNPIKKQLIRQLDELSPHELRAVDDLIDAFKGRTDRFIDEQHGRGWAREEAERSEKTERASASEAARRVRETLADVPGALSETVIEERGVRQRGEEFNR